MFRHSTVGTFIVLTSILFAGLPTGTGQVGQDRLPESVLTSPVMKASRKHLENVARTLARKGRRGEVEEIIALLGALGHSRKATAGLRRYTDAALTRVRKPASTLPAVARSLLRVAARLSGELETLEEEDRKGLARFIVKIDGQQAAANRILGRIQSNGRWARPDEILLEQGREKLDAALGKARKMKVRLKAVPCKHRLIAGADGDWWTIACRNVNFHTDLPREEAVSFVTDLARAAALSSHLRGGAMRVPEALGIRADAILTTLDSSYLNVIDAAVAARMISEQAAARERRESTAYFEDVYLECCPSVPNLFGAVVLFTAGPWISYGGIRQAHPGLAFGHTNWLALQFRNCNVPAVLSSAATTKEKESKSDHSLHRLTYETVAEEVTSWVKNKSDPPLDQILKDSFTDFNFRARRKWTTVAVYLQARGDFGALLKALRHPGKPDSARSVFLDRIGEPLDRFELKWKRWLLGSNSGEGIAQRLEKKRR